MGGCQARRPLPPRAPSPPGNDGEMFSGQKFPKCVAFQSEQNGNYLCYMHEGKGDANKFIQLNGKDVTNPCTRFCMAPSKEHSGLVHIRSCYNNKYWAAQRLHDGSWVVGAAEEAEEDLSKPTCTLFKTTGSPPGSIRYV